MPIVAALLLAVLLTAAVSWLLGTLGGSLDLPAILGAAALICLALVAGALSIIGRE